MSIESEQIPGVDRAWRTLLEALLAVAPENLDVPGLLRRLLEVARVLTSARYGALQVVDQDGVASEHVFTGFDESHSESERGNYFAPSKAGDAIPDSPAVMSIPIRRADRLYGHIYLAEKADGLGFTAEDSDLLGLLAAIAAAAVERASLGAEHQRRKLMVAGITALTTAVIEGAGEDAIQDITCEQAREIHDTDIAVVTLAKDVAGAFRIVRCERSSGLVVEGESLPYKSLTPYPAKDGEMVIPRRIGGRNRLKGESTSAPDPHLSMFTPIVADGRGIGTIMVANSPGGPDLDDSDREILQTFADRAALTIEYTRVRRELSRMAVYEERERIARDLHDTVIQELFAAGMGVEAIIPMVENGAAERLHDTVEALDSAIRDLRSMIFKLESEPRDGFGIRGAVASVIAEQSSALGFAPDVRYSGPIDSVKSEGMRDDVTAVLREALANIARHAAATSVALTLEVTGRELALMVQDNGVGASEYARHEGHGVNNIVERAKARGGVASIGPVDGEGTLLDWRVPLGEA